MTRAFTESELARGRTVPALKSGASLEQFIQGASIALHPEWVSSNPHMEDSDNMDNWRCVLRAGHRRMTVYFSKGVGHKGTEPTAAEVLDCLASDAAGVENARSFEEWCSEYGYDTDSRKAERIFKACARQAAALRRLLGDSAYETLLWKVERQ